MLPLKSLTKVPIALYMPLEGPTELKLIGCLLSAAWTKLWSSALGAGYFTCRGEVWAVHFWHLGCQGQAFTLGDTLREMWLRVRLTFGLNDQTLVQTPFSPRTKALPSDLKWSSWWQCGLEPFWAVEHDGTGLDEPPDPASQSSAPPLSMRSDISEWKKYSSSVLRCSTLPPDTNLSCLWSGVP